MQLRRSVHGNRRAPVGNRFSGNFAALFPGAYQAVQTNRGLTYGGALLANAGNTSTATMALTGTLATAPVPIWIKLTGTGTTGNIYYDGLGVTPAMSGVSVAATVPIALTGAASGLSITPSGGTLVTTDTWKATCAALADQSGNGKNFSQAGATAQLIITPGLGNGLVGLATNGATGRLLTSTNIPAAPGTTPWSMFAIFRQVSWTNSNLILYTAGAFQPQLVQSGVSPQVVANSGSSSAVNGGAALGTWVIVEINAGNSASDYLKLGTTPVTGSLGNVGGGTGMVLGSIGASADVEFVAFVHAPRVSDWTAIRAAVTALGVLA